MNKQQAQSGNDIVNDEEQQKGFYVDPKRDCPHLAQHFKANISSLGANNPCAKCQHAKENWVCLTCSKRFCSRYVKGHMKVHNEETGHPIAASYSDFSFWCYSCDTYITHTSLRKVTAAMSDAKFGGTGTGGRYTAHATDTQMEEIEESQENLEHKIKQLAELIRNSKHLVVTTGAGISTSAGIPDFRGPQGVWTLKAKNMKRTAKTTETLSAIPTSTHMALVSLQNAGILKFLISQNTDGLHRRSGIKPNMLSELHGNTNLEVCDKCGKEYMRDFATSNKGHGKHRTGRRCSIHECNGYLCDTIIAFGEKLPLHCVKRGFEECEKADLCIALGSSLTVTPAADMPKLVGKKKDCNLVIVNLQRTPLDQFSSLRIFGKTDQVMEGVMKELGTEIVPFRLKRIVKLRKEKTKQLEHGNNNNTNNLITVTVESIDSDNTPLTLFRGVEATWIDAKGGALGEPVQIDMDNAPFTFTTPSGAATVELKLFFMGHYNEPSFVLREQLSIKEDEEYCSKRYEISFNPMADTEWKLEEETEERNNKEEEEFSLEKYSQEIKDTRHEHLLRLVNEVYSNTANSGAFRCDACLQIGSGWVYHCSECQYDLHLDCAIQKKQN